MAFCYLSMDLAEKVISRLQMFIIISDVIIEDISEHYLKLVLLMNLILMHT
jgi:hypothetical protein